MKRTVPIYLIITISVLLLVISCKKDYDIVDIDETPYSLNVGNFTHPKIPVDNPLTNEGVRLGRMLFYETKLSSDNSMSCASCHNQQNAFTDTNRFSTGILGQKGTRQAMAVFNMAWNTNGFFWDGRAPLLRDQSLKPIQDMLEMNETLPNVIKKLEATTEYPNQFMRAFGTSDINAELMSKALEQFMNSIVSNSSRYDNFLAGKLTLSAQEERGRQLFFGPYNQLDPNAGGADCATCHNGDNFENDRYLGNGLDTDADFSDIGREKVSGNPAHKAWFKVPSLRNVAITAPYMHDGRFKTLEEVVNHYNLVKSSTTLDPRLQPQVTHGGLKLSSADKADLVAFLKTLTDTKLMTNPEYSNPF